MGWNQYRELRKIRAKVKRLESAVTSAADDFDRLKKEARHGILPTPEILSSFQQELAKFEAELSGIADDL